jgi:hypothetical protein
MSVILGFPVDRLLNKNLAIRLPGIGAWYSGSDDVSSSNRRATLQAVKGTVY